jgi:NSS family neurotransmitter:Na+ symporter
VSYSWRIDKNNENLPVSTQTTESWSGRLAFILASIGAAVGLGNIWQFPANLGASGGSAFVLVYVLAILLVATPIMLAEMIIGRQARRSAPSAMKHLAEQAGTTGKWSIVGWMGLFALLLVLSFYSVIAGWCAAYFFKSVSGSMAGLSAEQVGNDFGEFVSSPWRLLFWHGLFMAATVFIVSRGVKIGLERVVRIVMPALLITLVALVIYAAITGDAATAYRFLFAPDFSKLTPAIVLAAVGQAFFSVNVGVGSVLTYSAYLPKDVNLFRSAMAVAGGDTLVALLAGLAIFPIVFAYGLDPTEGAGLLFVTLSTAFAQMPGGSIVGAAFFLMLIFAALTSLISMLEAITARMHEIRGISRTGAAAGIGTVSFLLGIVTILSFSSWSDVRPLGMFEIFANTNPFDLIIYIVQRIIMPVAGVLYAIFAGWWMSRQTLIDQIGLEDGAVFKLWMLLVRVVAPLAIAIVFVTSLT